MTHQNNYNLSPELVGEITQNGLQAVPEMLRVLLNNFMQAERAEYLDADEYERTAERQGHANGFKTVKTWMGEVTFAIPQVREGGFYPTVLEKELRSERALTTTLAKMYVMGGLNPQSERHHQFVIPPNETVFPIQWVVLGPLVFWENRDIISTPFNSGLINRFNDLER